MPMQKIPNKNIRWLIGIDEVGRGPIAGPVTVGAFAVHVDVAKGLKKRVPGLTDSKKLSAKKREEIYTRLMHMMKNEVHNYAHAVVSVSAQQIDKKGISWSIKNALEKCLKKLEGYGCVGENSYVLLDGGLKAPAEYLFQKTIIKGDLSEPVISAASIVAKVTRDSMMVKLSQKKKYSGYGFEKHKGYGTRAHYSAIKKYGLSDLHRKTWIK